MKIICYNTNLEFRTFQLPTEWDYDVLGTYFGAVDAWNDNPSGNPIYYLTGSANAYDLRYKVSLEGGSSQIVMPTQAMLRLLDGKVFLSKNGTSYEEITQYHKEEVTLIQSRTYNYDTATGRVSSEQTITGGYKGASVTVQQGDIIAYNGKGGNNARLLALQDENTCDITSAYANTNGVTFYKAADRDCTVYFNAEDADTIKLYILRKP